LWDLDSYEFLAKHSPGDEQEDRDKWLYSQETQTATYATVVLAYMPLVVFYFALSAPQRKEQSCSNEILTSPSHPYAIQLQPIWHKPNLTKQTIPRFHTPSIHFSFRLREQMVNNLANTTHVGITTGTDNFYHPFVRLDKTNKSINQSEQFPKNESFRPNLKTKTTTGKIHRGGEINQTEVITQRCWQGRFRTEWEGVGSHDRRIEGQNTEATLPRTSKQAPSSSGPFSDSKQASKQRQQAIKPPERRSE
jgi:hypothetical protein